VKNSYHLNLVRREFNEIEIRALVRVPFAGLGEFGVRLRSKPNNHYLARLHEFRFDLIPSTPLAWIAAS
jgi:hypothetical protein